MGKSEHSFIHLVSQSVCQCMRVCYIPAGPGGATDWVIPPSDFGGGPQDHSSGSAYACNYLRFARHPMLGLPGASASRSRQVLGDQREPASTCSPMVGLMNALNHPLVHMSLPSMGLGSGHEAQGPHCCLPDLTRIPRPSNLGDLANRPLVPDWVVSVPVSLTPALPPASLCPLPLPQEPCLWSWEGTGAGEEDYIWILTEGATAGGCVTQGWPALRRVDDAWETAS